MSNSADLTLAAPAAVPAPMSVPAVIVPAAADASNPELG